MATFLGNLAVATALVLTACAAEGERAPGPLRVVATTAILGEFAREIAGADAGVATLIPPGADPHSFEAAPQAARDIAAADLILVNGYHLEGGLLDIVAVNRRRQALVVVAARGIPALAAPDEAAGEAAPPGGLPPPAVDEGDPHMWLDPDLAAKFAENIAAGFAEVDPAHAGGYQERGGALVTRLRALRQELATSLAVIPPQRRRMLVFHDAFAYFARAFEFQLAAGVLPEHGGREPSARALADAVALVRAESVPAVFSEPQFSSGLLDVLARETRVPVFVLYSDAYGGEVATYEAMMRANARALVQGLGAPPAR